MARRPGSTWIRLDPVLGPGPVMDLPSAESRPPRRDRLPPRPLEARVLVACRSRHVLVSYPYRPAGMWGSAVEPVGFVGSGDTGGFRCDSFTVCGGAQ
jgi:hypothetical protein